MVSKATNSVIVSVEICANILHLLHQQEPPTTMMTMNRRMGKAGSRSPRKPELGRSLTLVCLRHSLLNHRSPLPFGRMKICTNSLVLQLRLRPDSPKKDDTKVCVLDDLCHLCVDAKMPDLLSNVTALHRYWSRPGMTPLPDYHPKILAHHDFFSRLRKREDEILFSTAVIKLPIMVQQKILAVHRFGTVTGGSILYVDLEGINKSKYKADNGDEFVLLDDLSAIKQMFT
jgi:hypothetical protein